MNADGKSGNSATRQQAVNTHAIDAPVLQRGVIFGRVMGLINFRGKSFALWHRRAAFRRRSSGVKACVRSMTRGDIA